jgi:hypothetical protein
MTIHPECFCFLNPFYNCPKLVGIKIKKPCKLNAYRGEMLQFVSRLGFEPKTYGLEGRGSIQLSYRDILFSGCKYIKFNQPSDMKFEKTKRIRQSTINQLKVPDSFSLLHQFNFIFLADCLHFIRPNARLNLTNMSLPQKIHTQTRLANTSAN